MKTPGSETDQDLINVLDTLLKPVYKRMPLATFTKKFLPFLSLNPIPPETIDKMIGIIESTTGARHSRKDLHSNILNEWLYEVGSLVVDVEVYDTDGNVVYIVPSIFSDDPDIIENPASLPVLVEQASLQGKVLPESAIKYIRHQILPLIHTPKKSQRHIDMWNKIYRYHNLPLYKTDVVENVDGVSLEGRDNQGRLIVEDIDDFD